MSVARLVILTIIAAVYLTFIILTFIGAGYVSDVVFNSTRDQLDQVGLNTNFKRGLAKFTIILFWLVFVPLCLGPIVYLIAPKIYNILMDY